MAEPRTWYKSTLNMKESTIKETLKNGRGCVKANAKKEVGWCFGQLKTTIHVPLLLIQLLRVSWIKKVTEFYFDF